MHAKVGHDCLHALSYLPFAIIVWPYLIPYNFCALKCLPLHKMGINNHIVLGNFVELGLRWNRHLCLHVIFFELMSGIWCRFGMFTVLSCTCQFVLRLDKSNRYFTWWLHASQHMPWAWLTIFTEWKMFKTKVVAKERCTHLCPLHALCESDSFKGNKKQANFP